MFSVTSPEERPIDSPLRNEAKMMEGLSVTEDGKKSLASETISEGQTHEIWHLLQNPVLGETSFTRYALDDSGDDLEDLSAYVKRDLTQFPAFDFDPIKLRPRFQDMGLDFHNPDEGRIVIELQPSSPELHWQSIAIFVTYDTISENAEKAITIQARSEGQLI